MTKEKDFLQSIKIEIGRSFKLVPYERIAFHKILGLLKSENAIKILNKELNRGPDIRASAISTLSHIDNPQISPLLCSFLKSNISDSEKIDIFNHIENFGNNESLQYIIDYLDNQKEEPDSIFVISKAINALNTIGEGSEEVLNYLLSIVNSEEEFNPEIRSSAVMSLSSKKVVSIYEDLLIKNDDSISYHVFRALYNLNKTLIDAAQKGKDADSIFTYSPEDEDKIVLDIRVLLSKMTHKFDSYSNKTKVSFINAAISCNHREFLIFTMKALTSKDQELVLMTLFSLQLSVNYLRDPDKLFRNLLALSTELEVENELIVNIFVNYFSSPKAKKQFKILQDKLYSYIVVTFESYFETYRKEFIVTEVAEKGFPESFQRIRKFILEKFNSDYKKRLVAFLKDEEYGKINQVVDDLSKWATYLIENEKDDLSLLIEILYDKDKISRENSASRIEDINFEKRYLRNRIIRLCRIIGRIFINDAASTLVNIYNYLKKYPDYEIMDTVIHTLSLLNYSYMLGEIEVMLTTGTEEVQKKALHLISLYSEQRSLNVLLEFLLNRLSEESEMVESAIKNLLERDILQNATANQIFKKIIELNKKPEIRSLAILGIGKCGLESDIEYLNNLFFKLNRDEPRDFIVRAIGYIISLSSNFNKRILIRYLEAYLKDPGIRVRIYSCILLVQLGNKDALKLIRDMLIIKNKSIQRDILTILADFKNIEFSFFFISLLKEEYGITEDIISVLGILPEGELNEIDQFIVSIFRKFEAPELEGVSEPSQDRLVSIENLKEDRKTIFNIDMSYSNQVSGDPSIPDLINMNLSIRSLIASVILKNNGIISMLSNSRLIAFFSDPVTAVNTGLVISENLKYFNNTKIREKHLNICIQLLTDNVKIINDELIEIPEYKIERNILPILNRIILDNNTLELVKDSFSVKKVSELMFSETAGLNDHYELINPKNFKDISDKIIASLAEEEEKKELMQTQLQPEIMKHKLGTRSASSVKVAQDLENIDAKLKSQLDEIESYVQRRSTDRELIKNVKRMTANVYNLYKVEISRIIID